MRNPIKNTIRKLKLEGAPSLEDQFTIKRQLVKSNQHCIKSSEGKVWPGENYGMYYLKQKSNFRKLVYIEDNIQY